MCMSTKNQNVTNHKKNIVILIKMNDIHQFMYLKKIIMVKFNLKKNNELLMLYR